MQTTANRKADSSHPEIRERWGGNANEPISPKTLQLNVVTCGAVPTVATIVTDSTSSHIIINWLKTNTPGSTCTVTDVTPLPAFVSPYGIKTDSYKLGPNSRFEPLDIPRPHKVFNRWLTDKQEVSR